MPREAPHRSLGVEILFEITRPKQFSSGCVEAAEVALGADGIGLAATDEWSQARTSRIAGSVGAVVLVFPKRLAVRFTEAKDPPSALAHAASARVRRIVRVLGELPVRH